MTWTNPKTWVDGEHVGATELNTYLRDNLNELYPGHLIVANATERGALSGVRQGQMIYQADTGQLLIYRGAAWQQFNRVLDGSSALNAAESAASIKSLTGTNTNGVYWINLPTVGATQVYCIMDSAIDGGGWMMAMKATRGTTFQYTSSHWTTATTLNTGSTSTNDEDAKFHTMNHFAAKDMLALWPDLGQGGCISVSGYPFIWLQNNFLYGSRITPISFWSSVDRHFLGDANNFCGIANFSRQVDVRFYGFNYRNNTNNARTRWGFGWNENGGGLYPSGNMDSDDVFGGIGLDAGGFYYSAGDRISCCQNVTGINRSARVEIYIR